MRVKFTDTSLLLPSAPPPLSHPHTFSLSHLDNDPNLNVTFRYLRAYVSTGSNSDNPFHVISAALSSALVSYYPLAGSLRRRPTDNRLELTYHIGQGISLVNAAADCTLESVNYLDGSDVDLVEQLVPDPGREDGMANPCVLQVTIFECGGFCLGAAIHHALCDGLGASLFFNAVAELARGSSRISVDPVWERTSLLGPRDPARVLAPVGKFLRVDKGFEPYSEVVGVVVRECFHVEEEWLKRLKNLLFQKSGLQFTIFEALGAFIWRAKVEASKIRSEEQVKFAYSINIRKLLNPPLPAGYWGNGCVAMFVSVTARELTEQPLWKTAELIKQSKSNASDEYVRSFIDFQELHYGDGISAGKEVSGFTDWRHLGHSTVDFGWGGPVNVLPLSTNLLGSMEPCFFLPYSSSSGGRKNDSFKVLVTLRKTAMDGFREEMEKLGRGELLLG